MLVFLSKMFRECTGQASVWLSYSFMRYLSCPTLPIKRENSSCTIVMNLLISHEEEIDIDALLTLMHRWQNATGLLKVVLWMCDDEDRQPFYYYENNFLLLVNETVDNFPVATRIMNPAVLLSFMAKRPPNRNRMSFDLSDKQDAAQAQQMLLNKDNTCRGAYLFTNTMFYWGPPVEEGSGIDKDSATALLKQTFSEIRRHNTPVVVSSEAIRQFTLDRGFHVPFLGTLRFQEDEVNDYLNTLYDGMSTLGGQDVILTTLSMPGLSALIFDDCVIIHSSSLQEQPEQLMAIPSSMLQKTVDRFKAMVQNDAVALSRDKLIEII